MTTREEDANSERELKGREGGKNRGEGTEEEERERLNNREETK